MHGRTGSARCLSLLTAFAIARESMTFFLLRSSLACRQGRNHLTPLPPLGESLRAALRWCSSFVGCCFGNALRLFTMIHPRFPKRVSGANLTSAEPSSRIGHENCATRTYALVNNQSVDEYLDSHSWPMSALTELIVTGERQVLWCA
ncbi:hypothetical protein ISCGN_010841 [Ixodes scapularis]